MQGPKPYIYIYIYICFVLVLGDIQGPKLYKLMRFRGVRASFRFSGRAFAIFVVIVLVAALIQWLPGACRLAWLALGGSTFCCQACAFRSHLGPASAWLSFRPLVARPA